MDSCFTVIKVEFLSFLSARRRPKGVQKDFRAKLNKVKRRKGAVPELRLWLVQRIAWGDCLAVRKTFQVRLPSLPRPGKSGSGLRQIWNSWSVMSRIPIRFYLIIIIIGRIKNKQGPRIFWMLSLLQKKTYIFQ